MTYDAIIVGGGIAGLTSAAYLTKKGYSVLLCEKEPQVGGLVNSFYVDGFLFDTGARGIVNSGIVKPMLKELNIDIEFVEHTISIGFEDQMIHVRDLKSIEAYRQMLFNLYPGYEKDIDSIILEIHKIMGYMQLLYGIDNPLFMDLKHDRDYLFKTLMPWLIKFLFQSGKLKHYEEPVDTYLKKFTKHQPLIDIISQHFFQKTPASFALSYFSLYLDYMYPKNGTIELIDKIKAFILDSSGEIKTSTKIISVDPILKTITDQNNNVFGYKQLIWAADNKALYHSISTEAISSKDMKEKINDRKRFLNNKRGGDSVYTLFLTVDEKPSYFGDKSSGHCFYTPKRTGQSEIFKELDDIKKSTSKEDILKWIDAYLAHTTYEISIPSLRNEQLSQTGKTGLIISVLMDYDFIQNIQNLGFYDEFKKTAEQKIIDVISDALYQNMKNKVIQQFSSTPLTIEKLSGNLDGGITGWAFTNDIMPAVNKITQVKKSCLTPIPNILQAGQWTFSPSGLPISILTGKIASLEAIKRLIKEK